MATKRVRKIQKSLVETQEMPISPVSNSSIIDKLRKPKIFMLLIVIVLAIALFLLKGLFIAALVNGQPIARLSILAELEKRAGQQILQGFIDEALISQEARKKNIEVSQKEIDAAAKEIDDTLKSQGQSLDTALAADGLTRKDIEKNLRIQVLHKKLLADKVKVTDKEVADYIEKNKETLPTDLKEDELNKEVRQQLEQQKLGSASQAWLEELRKNAKINIFVNY